MRVWGDDKRSFARTTQGHDPTIREGRMDSPTTDTGAAPERQDSALIAQAETFVAEHGAALLEVVTRERALFTPAHLDAVLQDGIGAVPMVPALDLRRAIARTLLASDTVLATEPGADGTIHYTSRAFYGLERALLATAQTMQEPTAALLANDDLATFVKEFRSLQDKRFEKKLNAELVLAVEANPHLAQDADAYAAIEAQTRASLRAAYDECTDEMQEALEALFRGESGRLLLVDGPPGAGKSTILEAIALAFGRSASAEAGILVTTQSHKVLAELMADTKAPGVVLDQLLTQLEGEDPPVQPGGMILLDEAGLVGSRQMARLLALTDQLQITLVMTGDGAQLPPRSAGEPFPDLCDRLTVHHLTHTFRQNDPKHRQAVLALRSGRALDGLRLLPKKWLTGAQAVAEAVAADFAQFAATRWHNGETAVVMTQDEKTAGIFNGIVREALLREDLLGAATSVQTLAGMREFAVGDRVILQQSLEVEGAPTAVQAPGTLAEAKFMPPDRLRLRLPGTRRAKIDLTLADSIDPATVGKGLKSFRDVTITDHSADSISLQWETKKGAARSLTVPLAAPDQTVLPHGTTAIVADVAADRIVLEVDKTKGTRVRIDTDSLPALDYAYALSGYDGQGITADRIFVPLLFDTDKPETLVLASRGAQAATLFPNLEQFPDLESLAESASRRRPRLTTLALADRFTSKPGVRAPAPA